MTSPRSQSIWVYALIFLALGAAWLFLADPLLAKLFPNLNGSTLLSLPAGDVIKYAYLLVFALFAFPIAVTWLVRTRANVLSELADERALHDALRESTNMLVLVLDTNGKITYLNHATEHSLGYTLNEIQGEYAWDFLVPADEIPNERARLEQVRAGKKFEAIELAWLTQSQKTRIISWNITLVRPRTSQEYILHTGEDLTEQIETRHALQISQTRLEALQGKTSDIVLILDSEGKISEANAAFEKALGYAAKDWGGTDLTALLHPSEVATFRNLIFADNSPALTPQRFRFLARDEKWHTLETAVTPLSWDGSTNHLLTARDLTPLLKAEEKVILQASRLQLVTEAARTFSEITHQYPDVVEMISKHLGEWLGDVCIIYILTPDQKWLKPIAHFHPETAGLARLLELCGTTRRVDELVSGRAVQSAQSIFIPTLSLESLGSSSDAWQIMDSMNATSLLIAPLAMQGRVLGAIEMWRLAPHAAFTLDDQGLLDDFAHRTALTIANARLVNEAEHRLNRLQALRNIDMAITASLDLRVTLNVFLDQVTTQLRVDAANILLLNSHMQMLEYVVGRGFHTNTLQFTHLQLGEGYAGRAALERRIITVNDLYRNQNEFYRAPLFKNEEFVSYCAVPLVAKGHLKGVMELFNRSPLDFDHDWMEFVEALATEAAIAMENAALFDDLQRANVELTLAYDKTLEGWVKALDLRDHETEGHTQRVTDISIRLARALNVSDMELVHIRRGALLHDIGKIGISDSILLKPGPLTDEEREIMQMHPVYAYEMLSPIAYLRPAIDIPYCHHEKWDGTGYPRGLQEDQIPLAARIFAVADVLDALSSDRPYHAAWAPEKVREWVRDQVGKHFDPRVVSALMELGLDMSFRRGL
ncbi:MAG TPA: HD domain-containing phosphohydrolase [Anaerolineae bacterium]